MVTRWWVVLCVTVILDAVLLEPTENGQKECCPCPKGSSARVSDGAPSDMDGAGSAAEGVRAAVGAECPCRARDAEGAASMFFPAAVRAVRPFVNLEDSKENPDPLLHPEVNLASSVLETLRQATDEEYKEALARDAARAADEEAAESRNMVTVIANPNTDDVMSEASHVHEARCVDPPLGRSRASARKPSILLSDILNMPKNKQPLRSWNLFDIDSGVAPSNVNERIIKGNVPDFKPTPESSMFTDSKPRNPLGNLSLRVPDLTSNLNKDSSFHSAKPILPKLRTTSKIDIPSISNLIPKVNTPNLLRKSEDDDANASLDSENAASVVEERYTGFVRDNSQDMDTKPVETTARSSFKIPNINFGEKRNPSNFKVTLPSERRDAVTDLLSGILRGLEVPNLNNLFPAGSDVFNLRNNDATTKSNNQKETTESTQNNKPISTEILDAVPSPTEIKSDHVSFDEVKREGGINNDINTEDEDVQKIIEQNPMKTEILDAVSKTSDVSEVNEEQPNMFNDDAKGNTVSSEENSDLNNEMEEMKNIEIIDDASLSASDRDSQLENINPSQDISSDNSSDMIAIDASELIDTCNNIQRNGLTVDDNGIENISLRDRIRNTLESLKNRHKNNNLMTDESKSFLNDDFVTNGEQLTSVNEDSEKLSTQIIDTMKSKDETSPVDIEDLQQMSDSLLDQEKLRKDSLAVENDIEQNGETLSNDFESNDRESSDASSTDNSMMESNNLESVSNQNNIEACLENGISGKSQPNSDLNVNAKSNEMASEASERVTNTVLGDKLSSTLRQSIVQPPSLNDLNWFNLPPLNIGDGYKINNPLSSIFNARENVDDISSTLDDDVDDLTSKQKMSPSTSSFRSIFPPVKPLEDINLNILQLKPSSPEMPTLPRLNLNSFKTKLAIPESLQLRPLLLESSMGNKKGVVGATLTFGNDKKGMGRSNMLPQASLKTPNILGRSLGTFPSLEELREAMWENTHNLFNTPLQTTGKNVVEDTLRSSQVLTENLRVEAENKVKDIEQNLKSTFGGVGLNNHGLLSSPTFRNPNDFFDEISRRHEDVNDKLKGIHYDLSDRLETLRNNIFEDYRIPPLGSSLLPSLGSSLGSPMPRKNSFAKSKSKSSNLSGKAKSVTQSSSSGSKGKFTVGRSSTNKNKLKMPAAASVPSFKTIDRPTFKNAEAPVFKTLGRDGNSKLFNKEKPSLDFLRKTEKNVIDAGSPFSKKPTLSKLGLTKVKISFSTTELPPILKNKPRFNELTRPKPISIKDSLSVPALQKTSSKDTILPSLPRSAPRDKLGLLRSLKDSSGFGSEPVYSRVKVPFRERQSIEDLSSIRRKAAKPGEGKEPVNVDNTASRLVDTPLFTKPKTNLRVVFDRNLGRLNTGSSLKSKSSSASDEKVSKLPLKTTQLHRAAPISWPKSLDDKFLAKVREALKARLAGINQSLSSNPKLEDLRKPSSSLAPKDIKTGDIDMARSASNNIDVAEVGPGMMKENTSYSCKMMCTKNT